MAESQPPAPQAFEDYPLTRIEYITALTHFYRGERSRADAWRAPGLLGLESTGDTVDWRAARGMVPVIGAQRSWVLSSAGQVPSRALRPHVDWLLVALAGNEATIARLRAEDYWACVSFHYLWQDAPEAAEAEAISAELEKSDVCFDLELELDDFP